MQIATYHIMQELDFWEPSDDPGQSSTTSGNNDLETESEDEDHLYIVNEEFNRKTKKKKRKSTRVKRFSHSQNDHRDSFPSEEEGSYDLPAPRTTLSYFEYCQHLENEICQQENCHKVAPQTNCIQIPPFRKPKIAEKLSGNSRVAGKFKDSL